MSRCSRADSPSSASRMALFVTVSRAIQTAARSGFSASSDWSMDSSWREAGKLLTCGHSDQKSECWIPNHTKMPKNHIHSDSNLMMEPIRPC